LDNSHKIVSYSIVQGDGLTPALATDKGIIDLVNSDPLIGNFNNFNNIENALSKPSNGFTINPLGASGTNIADKVWTSPDITGTATGEAPKSFNADLGNDALYGRNNTSSAGDVTLSGGDGNDLIDGRTGNDTLSGGAGNDYLFGGLGNDTLDGGDGNDILVGSYGVDTVHGGLGSDIFVLQRGGIEQINDFQPGTDTLWVATFNGTATPQATFSATGLAGAPAGTDAVYDPTNGNFYFDPDGTGTGVNPVLVAVLSPNLNIQNSDVVIDPMVQAIAGTQLSGNSGGTLSNVLPTAQEPSWQQHALAGSTG
jgi:Ca2+-binding RTX toxin-like protein